MRIYLADLYHVQTGAQNPDTAAYTVPLGIGYLAAKVKRHVPEAAIRLFRDPERLLSASRESPPDILGLCFTSWNMDLSQRAARWVRRWSPATATVGGGPCIDERDEALRAFFARVPELDYLVPNEGEQGFLELVKHLRGGGRKESNIPGVAYLDRTGQLVRGKYQLPETVPAESIVGFGVPQARPAVKVAGAESDALEREIPSPYLDGTLDPFLKEGLVPIIQTMRGCPYRCEFCVSGTTLWSKLRGFPLERVKAEIDYAFSRSHATDLILTDENWGILGARDVELARFIALRRATVGTPRRIYYYTAKIVNDASRAIVEEVAHFTWGHEFSMSFQTLNQEARKAIKRTNIPLHEVAANAAWARARNITPSSEMIFGFPFETVDSFLDGIETLLDAGIGKVAIFPLTLFPGIDLDTDSARREYGLKTRFRVSPHEYGIYSGGELISVESEEIVVATRWSGEEGYFQVRRYGFFQNLLLYREYFNELFQLCREADIPLTRLNRSLALSEFAGSPGLRAIMEAYDRDARAELMATHEDVVAAVSARLKEGESLGGFMLNLVYLGKIMSSQAAVTELLELVEQYVCEVADSSPFLEVVRSYLREVLPNRVVIFHHSVEKRVTFDTHFDYRRWRLGDYQSLLELHSPLPLMFEATVPDHLLTSLADFDGARPSALQGIFDTARMKVLRNVEAQAISTNIYASM